MQRIFTILKATLPTLLIALISCETERIIFTGPYHVRFTEASSFSKESFTKPIKIEVHNVGPAKDEDIFITYSISGAAREGIDFELISEPGTVKIPAGEHFGYIEFRLINNANNILRSQDIVFTLETVTAGDLQTGQGQSAIGRKYTFTIFDDCILGGTYSGARPGSFLIYRNITITSSDCETFTLSNWNIDIDEFETNAAMDLKFIDNADNTLTIPVQKEENLPNDKATIQGTGVVNPSTGEITMTIELSDYENKPKVSFTLTPD